MRLIMSMVFVHRSHDYNFFHLISTFPKILVLRNRMSNAVARYIISGFYTFIQLI